MIRSLVPEDYKTWMNIVEEIEPLFGPIIESTMFHQGIKSCITNNEAFGIETENGILAAILHI